MKRRENSMHEIFMLRAIKIAQKAYNFTSPNPKVGCVIVKGGRIIAEGYHRKCGAPHAEAEALKKAGSRAKGADLYVNLEPCCHYGKTPPCTKAIIAAGIKRVFIGVRDPNPKVHCRGIKELNDAGIKTVYGVAEQESRDLNAPFFKSIEEGKPYVICKISVTLDGRITKGGGRRVKISSDKCLAFSYRLRNFVDAILVGGNTALLDNPKLLPMPLLGKKPLRVALDPELCLGKKSNLLGKEAVIFYSTKKINEMKAKIKLLSKKALLFPVDGKNGKLNLGRVLRTLNSMGINSLLVEGGAEVFASFVNEGHADLIIICLSPRVFGKGKTVFDKLEKDLSFLSCTKIGDDLLIEAKPSPYPLARQLAPSLLP